MAKQYSKCAFMNDPQAICTDGDDVAQSDAFDCFCMPSAFGGYCLFYSHWPEACPAFISYCA
jgi:hypothetical protein